MGRYWGKDYWGRKYWPLYWGKAGGGHPIPPSNKLFRTIGKTIMRITTLFGG